VASETGGQAFFPKSEPELLAAISQVSKLIRSGYLISYKPIDSSDTLKSRQVKVRIVAKPERQGWITVTRAGYVISDK
jgi:hypothetical protein